MGPVGKLLGVIQILVAIFNLDPARPNGIIISVLLFLGGLLMIITDIRSPMFGKFRRVLAYTAILISLALIIKVLAFD